MIQIQGIGNQTGKKFWRSLDELSNSPKFQNWVAQEFPEGAADVMDGKSRRKFLQVMAASMGLAGLTACRRPVEKILPYAKSVEGVVMGNSLHFATAMPFNGGAQGLVVESFDGRPIKIEGNTNHPESRGAAGTLAQASVLNLYDPDRSKEVLADGKPSTWDSFSKVAATLPADGEGVRVLSTLVNSPTLAGLRGQLASKMPKAKWVEYEAFTDDTLIEGSQIAFGDALRPQFDFKKANVVVALDFDFLELENRSLGWVKDFSARRKPAPVAAPASHHGAAADAHHAAPAAEAHHGAPAATEHAAAPPAAGEATPGMNRLYAIESNFTLTGVMADNRLRLKPSDVQNFVFDLARALGAITGLQILGQQDRWIKALAKDLQANRGKSIVLAGSRQPAVVHAVVALINQTLGNAGETVTYTKDVRRPVAALKELAGELNSGGVKALVILGGNPVYDAPVDLAFGDAVKKAPLSIHLGPEVNETGVIAKWHLPESHYLEAWGDVASNDGSISIVQPLIEPLFATKSAIEIVGFLLAGKWPKGFELVKAQSKLDEAGWRKALHDGLLAGTAGASVKGAADKTKVEAAVNNAPKTGGRIEVQFFPSHNLWDGRFANNAWLQEAPDPMSKLVWDNAAVMSPKTAKELQVEIIPDDVGMYAQKIIVEIGGQKVEAPVYVLPGHADNTVTLMCGYGRKEIGRVGRGIGYNAFAVRPSTGLGFASANITKAPGTYYMVSTQEHHSQEGRPIVQEAPLAKYEKEPHFAKEEEEHVELFSLFQEHDYSKGNQWGMAIDLNACTGCNSCLIACQSENNIPVVGKEQVGKGREMHWIRLDRYFTGDEEDPQAVYQPMACQQCENAPCESVCPVAATVHSPEGLNDMAYNRCVGTRYCANNCPYKVRRFNYLNFHKDMDELTKMVQNPDVTVRMRGVMEKCNYCVQRIQEAKIKAKAEGRASGAAGPYKVGEFMTACQQTCAADAIVFGNINDPESKVSQLKKDHRNYALLHELNVKPRTTYLAKLRNPNPELA
ncbi:MAG TPA: TAT-variant-translocated molybdopterin oxidoreductase [Bryobacteraceae bacterium]|nr:TAT-variant-translocated molybdopterin oxidoreductase [Bryobacteraceae bacterium]